MTKRKQLRYKMVRLGSRKADLIHAMTIDAYSGRRSSRAAGRVVCNPWESSIDTVDASDALEVTCPKCLRWLCANPMYLERSP